MISIIPATPAHRFLLAALCNLQIEAFKEGASLGLLNGTADEDAMLFWSNVFGRLDERHLLWVALDEDEVVGTVQLELCNRRNAPHRAELQKLIVRQSHRGTGLARQLVACVEQAARVRGIRLLVLGAESHTRAERFYLKEGYHLVGRIPEYALDPQGRLHDTSYFCKLLEAVRGAQ